MDIYQKTIVDSGAVSGRGYLGVKNGRLEAPENIIMTVQAARTYYQHFRISHVERIKLMAAVEGLIAGNSPYNSAELAAAGLAHIANVNTLDAKAMFERAALTFWNLIHQTENLVVFTVRPFQGAQDHNYSDWGQIMSRNWTQVIREDWEDFTTQMNLLTGQLVKFGVSPLIWSDERDFRWTTVDLSRFFCADQTSVMIDKWDCICVETLFTVQYLYQTYLEVLKHNEAGMGDNGWNLSALEAFLVYRANLVSKGTTRTQYINFMDIQQAMQNKSLNLAHMFTDSVPLVSLLYKEFSGKISHFIFDPLGMGTEDFLLKMSEQYDSFNEVLQVFTYSPSEMHIHGNKGVGHKLYPVCQALMQVDNNIIDMTKMAATPIVKSNPVTGKSLDPIQFISGVATNIGSAEFVQNNLGTNIPGLVQVAQYLNGKVTKNSIIGGDDPGAPDADRGSKSAPEVQMQSIKEFGVGKQNVAHFYDRLDKVFRQMAVKMFHCKPGHPGYEIVERWKELCLEEGVPEEVFSVKDDNKLPKYVSVRAARVAGDGSNLGLIMGLNGVAGIAGGFGQKGQYNYRKDVITSRLGIDYVDRYLSDSSEPDEAGSGASVAFLENLVMQDGKMPHATEDNYHRVHIGTHMALVQQTIQQLQAQKLDPTGADQVFSAVIPHIGDHIQFLQGDVLNQQYIDQLMPSWKQVNKIAQLNRVKAQKMMQAEVRRRAKEEQQMNADMMEQQRKDAVSQREQQRKDYESQQKQERAKEQSQTKAEIMKADVEKRAENKRLEIQLKAQAENAKGDNIVRTPQELLADKSTEDLQKTLTTQVGTTPNPADFA